MKTKTIITTLLVLFISITTLLGQSKTDSFKVFGNCGMCKKRIEKAALSVDGVSAAVWNKETKKISVTYDMSKTDLQTIKKAIVEAGHDTNELKADDKTYNSLPGCCHYEREPLKPEE